MLFSLFSLVMTCFLTTSCGYQVGSMMHPQIQSIAVADVKNDTKEPYVSSVMRGNLAEQFQVDGSLKLTKRTGPPSQPVRITPLRRERAGWGALP